MRPVNVSTAMSMVSGCLLPTSAEEHNQETHKDEWKRCKSQSLLSRSVQETVLRWLAVICMNGWVSICGENNHNNHLRI